MPSIIWKAADLAQDSDVFTKARASDRSKAKSRSSRRHSRRKNRRRGSSGSKSAGLLREPSTGDIMAHLRQLDRRSGSDVASTRRRRKFAQRSSLGLFGRDAPEQVAGSTTYDHRPSSRGPTSAAPVAEHAILNQPQAARESRRQRSRSHPASAVKLVPIPSLVAVPSPMAATASSSKALRVRHQAHGNHLKLELEALIAHGHRFQFQNIILRRRADGVEERRWYDRKAVVERTLDTIRQAPSSEVVLVGNRPLRWEATNVKEGLSAALVQTLARGHLARRYVVKTKAVTHIQRCVRGFLGRILFRTAQKYVLMEVSVFVLQKWWRGMIPRRNFRRYYSKICRWQSKVKWAVLNTTVRSTPADLLMRLPHKLVKLVQSALVDGIKTYSVAVKSVMKRIGSFKFAQRCIGISFVRAVRWKLEARQRAVWAQAPPQDSNNATDRDGASLQPVVVSRAKPTGLWFLKSQRALRIKHRRQMEEAAKIKAAQDAASRTLYRFFRNFRLRQLQRKFGSLVVGLRKLQEEEKARRQAQEALREKQDSAAAVIYRMYRTFRLRRLAHMFGHLATATKQVMLEEEERKREAARYEALRQERLQQEKELRLERERAEAAERKIRAELEAAREERNLQLLHVDGTIEQTTEALARVMNGRGPPLKASLMHRPPFKFLRDVIFSISQATRYFENDELLDSNGQQEFSVRTDRESLLLRVVSQVSSDLQIDDFVISAKKVLAGQETETTRKMLHFLAIAAAQGQQEKGHVEEATAAAAAAEQAKLELEWQQKKLERAAKTYGYGLDSSEEDDSDAQSGGYSDADADVSDDDGSGDDFF